MPTMPWPGIEKYFVCKGNRGNNFLVQCVLCRPSSKLLSVSKTSPSNLKRHIKVCYETFTINRMGVSKGGGWVFKHPRN